MDHLTLVLLISFMFIIFLFIFRTRTSQSAKNPPGPRPLPIIGNILELGTQPHQSLTNLSRTYGPVMTLKLGRTTTIVISSPQVAKEVLQKKDHAFSFRSIPDTIRALDHHAISVAWMPPSTQWRVLKRICSMEVFSSQRLDSTQTLRQRKVQELLNHVSEFCRKGEALDIGDAVFTTVLNSISNTFSHWICLVILLISLRSLRTLYGVSWRKLEGLILWTFSQFFVCLIHNVHVQE